ncbi:MAG: hypothetical protein H6834_08210 [Planctomycetes bacterium]|nr:hypothetical protein [Planctomycetota bacterium]
MSTRLWELDIPISTEYASLYPSYGEPRNAVRCTTCGKLMARVFELDVLRCPCGARRHVIAEITDPIVIRAILEHLNLPATLPDLAPARPPPQPALPFEPA